MHRHPGSLHEVRRTMRVPGRAKPIWLRRAAGYVAGPLHHTSASASALNDGKVGRSLDRLVDADRASMLSALMVRVIERSSVALDELHNDSTSINHSGADRDDDGHRERSKPTSAVRHGRSKDHRPDLKQLVWILTISKNGAAAVCKLTSRAALERIDTHKGRFVTVVPRTRSEDQDFRHWFVTHEAL